MAPSYGYWSEACPGLARTEPGRLAWPAAGVLLLELAQGQYFGPWRPPGRLLAERLAGLAGGYLGQASKRRVKFCDYRPLPAWKSVPPPGAEKPGTRGVAL